MISSIAAVVDGKAYDTDFMLPLRPHSFAKILRKAKNKKSEYFVLEATSHAIDQNRITGIPVLSEYLLILRMSISIIIKLMTITLGPRRNY